MDLFVLNWMFICPNSLGLHVYWPARPTFAGVRWQVISKEGLWAGLVLSMEAIRMLTWKVTWPQFQAQLLFPRVFSISTPKYKQPQFKKEKQKPVLYAEKYFRAVWLSSP